jgi:hypothetical protein
MIQYMRWGCNSSCFLLVNMCFCYVSQRSRWMPKYLAVSLCGICCPFNVTAGQVSRFKETVIWVDLFSLAFMRHRFNHFSSWLRWCWRFVDAGRRHRTLLDDPKERRGYSHLKEEALDRTMWRVGVGKGFGPVIRQTTKWMRYISQMNLKVKCQKLSDCRLPGCSTGWSLTWQPTSEKKPLKWTHYLCPKRRYPRMRNISEDRHLNET